MTWSDRARPLLLVALLLAGCSGEKERGFQLDRAVMDGTVEGFSFSRPPEVTELEIDHERRPVVLTASSWTWRGVVPPGASLHAGVQTLPAVWSAIRGIEAWVVASDGEERELLDVARVGPVPAGEEPRWLNLRADLARYADREVTLEFHAALDGLPAEHRESNLVAWGPVSVSAPEPAGERKRPNVLLIVVDTLRWDRLTPYGYKRETSPEIARWLAEPGTVVEEAYSQAPWTLPSVVSFLTGRTPGDLLGPDPAAYGIPDSVSPLAERMAALGYETGGFVANPTLHAGAGFGRGFRTFYAPPADVAWIRRHADELNRHALPWLAASQDRPFFLYVHYIDPHDPYENPDVVDNRSPFETEPYTGPITGDWIHGIYTGRIPLEDPKRDLAHIDALYDSEVRYVDRFIGELLATMSPEVLADTLIVLTADHGEELYDHGGWKHGQTLYEEQIHVPLLVRWDGRVKAGSRLPGTVRLLDLVPTIVAAAGGEADPAWDGVNLLPALTGQGPLPRRPAFAQHLSSGPLRAAAVLGKEKLILFNREEPFEPADGLQAHLWEQDLGRLGRVELYDLARDPRERAGHAAPIRAGRLAPIVHGHLDAQLPGLRVLLEGAPAGSRWSGSIAFERAPERWRPYFLGPEDRVDLSGSVLRFDLKGEAIAKGFRVEGDIGAVRAVEARRDGRPLPAGRVLVGRGTPYGGGALAPAALNSPHWPVTGGVGGGDGVLRLWRHLGAGEGRRTEVDPETEKRLRNLGYIQ
jgi:arylsulfatase A-like enzyme